MAEDTIRNSGTKPGFKDDRGGGVLIPHPVIAIVKDNIDPTHSGRIRVYIARFGGSDPSDQKQWRTVKYLSPWFGTIAPNFDVYDGPDKTGLGKYVGNPHSYGFWATAPDIGSKVICIFIDGNPQDGYYVGCVPYAGLTHMVPAIGAASLVVPNAEEAKTYGGADRLPVTEVNYSNPDIRNSPEIYSKAKPVHAYQASILAQQGLIRDNVRGVIGSSSQRETPSRVFGISTPGQAIYEGGYTNSTIDKAATPDNSAKLQVIGRTGGHSFVMDDGKLNGEDQLVRLRTAAGHMLMMSDSGQVLTIIHANGQSYIELGKEGTVDVYSSNSINLRSQGDINFHADRDLNLHAKRNLNMFGENVKIEADKNLSNLSGKDFTNYAAGKYTLKVDTMMSLESTGPSSFKSATVTFINGKVVLLNTGFSPIMPGIVPPIPKINHVDTTFSQNKTWMNPSPDPLLSVTSRAPAHMPWAAANKGVDVSSAAAQPISQPQPTMAVQAAIAASPSTPETPTNNTVLATAPPQTNPSQGAVSQLPAQTVTALISQQAVNSAHVPFDEKLNNGIVAGTVGATLTQLSAPGQSLKPGAGAFVQKLQQKAPALNFPQLASNVVMTGTSGIKDAASLLTNIPAQIGAVTNSIQSATSALTKAGILNGAEAPTQAAGVIFAAANNGVAAVTEALKSPTSLLSSVGGSIPGVGGSISSITGSIASGNFAAGLADKFTSGLSGVTSSLAGIGNSITAGLNGLTGGLTAGLGGITAGLGGLASGALGLVGSLFGGGPVSIKKLIDSLRGAAKKAYDAAEKSFGELKANEANALGGAASSTNTVFTQSEILIRDRNAALTEYASATKNLAQARRAFKEDESADNYQSLQAAEARFSAAEQKKEQALSQLDNLNRASTSNDLFGNIGAQKLTALGAATDSGMLTSPSSKNTGLNALPGGINAFVNQVNTAASSVTSSIKSISTILSDPSKLVGNLVSNVQQKIETIGSAVTQKLGSITNAVTAPLSAINNLIGNASAPLVAVSSLIGSAAGAVSGVFSGITSMLGSFGKSPGLIKQAVLASNTFAARPAINAKVGALLGDTRVPPPTSDVVEVKIQPDAYQKLQVEAQQNIAALLAEREVKSYELDSLTVAYSVSGQPSDLEKIASVNDSIADLDDSIVVAQATYNNLITNG